MSDRKHVLMLTTQLGYGGAETSFIRLANYLAQSMDVTVALFTSDYGMDTYAKGHEPLNAKIVLLDEPGNGRVQRWRHRIIRLRNLKRDADATISFLSGPNLVNVLAGGNTRSIVSLRGSRIYDPVAPKRQRLLFHYVLDPIIFRLAARIVPVSSGLSNELEKAVRRKSYPIPPFVELSVLQQKLNEPALVAYTALKGQPVIIGVGRLSIEKGFQHLIRVFGQLAKQQPGVKLLLVGDGPMLPVLRVQCEELGIVMDDATPGVSSALFAGYQPNVLPLMALARVFALTSATEGFPSVLLEAMLADVPVIAADTPWGARSVLGGESTMQPYPTTQPTPTSYGTLMPRIDAPKYQAQWVNVLAACVQGNQPKAQKAAMRPAEFDVAHIGAQWLQLIVGLEQIKSKKPSAETLHPSDASGAEVPLLLRRIINRLARPLGINPFPRAFEYALSAEQNASTFDTIYEENRWGSDNSRSGVGSELATTKRYRAELARLIQRRGFESMFDAPCGDLNWMPSLLAVAPIRYVGGDISAAVVAGLQQRYPQMHIRQFDICRDAFPQADVWHCRDCLFHLPLTDIRRALENFVKSDIPYALLTTHHARFQHKNLDLNGIGFRFLDLEWGPISLPTPLIYLPDYKIGSDFPRYVGLWTREMIAAALQRTTDG